jgi:hypothetical protein
MSMFINSVATPSVRKWMRSELVVAPLAFAGALFIYVCAPGVFSALGA